mmetsp:Transcript_13563/g.29931  ORF Transcript_13563/g.29931 Transcript_13563/m.29931 type:complete len:161 (-) Transcript_13563:85-567(-)
MTTPKAFVALLLTSALFFFLGFTVGLPMIAVRPQKFALSFTCGSLTFMGAFAILRGPVTHLKGMFSSERWVFSLVYFASMFATLYSTMKIGGVEGYVVVIGCSAVQILALLWYLLAFLPGGSAGLGVVASAAGKMLWPLLSGCTLVVKRCCGAILGYATG